jgi:hypothetical protein
MLYLSAYGNNHQGLPEACVSAYLLIAVGLIPTVSIYYFCGRAG